MDVGFRVLGVTLSLSGPAPLVSPIATAYARFALTHPAAPAVRIEATSEGILMNGRLVPFVRGFDATAQVYQMFLTSLLDRVPAHAVFHSAAVVDGTGRALLLAAPTGHGKSSLTLELVRRGFRFLSDDYAPVDLDSSVVLPFPRTVSVVPHGAAPIPAPVRDAADRPESARLFGKAIVDVGGVFGEDRVAAGGAPLGTVVVLAPQGDLGDPFAGTTWLDLTLLPQASERVEGELAAIPGLSVVERGTSGLLRMCRVRVNHAARPTEALSRILEDEGVVFAEKHWNALQDFDADPVASPLKHREAALFLAREVLNRRPTSRFLAAHGGDPTRLLIAIAGALREAACWHVQVGRFVPTADLIQSLTRAPAG